MTALGPPLLLAVAERSDEIVDQVNQVGWFLPFLLLIVPVSIVLFFVLGKALYALLLAAQIAGLALALRAIVAHLRRTGFTSFQVKIMLGPLYLVVCFATNIVVLLVFGIIRKFF